MFGLGLKKSGTDPRAHRQEIGGAWGGYAKTNDGLASGFVAGTRIATSTGWRPVETLAEGDQVLTFDGGMQELRGVIRGRLWRNAELCPESLWPLYVPAGALGNRQPMELLPEQAVLIESDTADAILDDPFTLVSAASLAGFRGIERIAPQEEIDVIQLVFDQDEVVFAASGALVHCPRVRSIAVSELLSGDACPARYRALHGEEAALLVDCLREEDEERAAPQPQLAA